MAAHQAPPSLGFSRQEHWSGLPFPSPMHEREKSKWSRSVTSDPQRPHGPQPTRLLRPWDFPGRSTGVGCLCLFQQGDVFLRLRCSAEAAIGSLAGLLVCPAHCQPSPVAGSRMLICTRSPGNPETERSKKEENACPQGWTSVDRTWGVTALLKALWLSHRAPHHVPQFPHWQREGLWQIICKVPSSLSPEKTDVTDLRSQNCLQLCFRTKLHRARLPLRLAPSLRPDSQQVLALGFKRPGK